MSVVSRWIVGVSWRPDSCESRYGVNKKMKGPLGGWCASVVIQVSEKLGYVREISPYTQPLGRAVLRSHGGRWVAAEC